MLRNMKLVCFRMFSLVMKHGSTLAGILKIRTVGCAVVKVFLHLQKIGAWCAVSCQRVVGPIFFEVAVNGDVYWDIITQVIALLDKDESYG